MDYSEHFSTRVTPQSEAIPGETQVMNAAGGFVYEVDKWSRLGRFLVLGSEGGTYYASERSLTADNAVSALACIQEDGLRVVNEIVQVSEAGRAPSNDPALCILAMASAKGDDATRELALDSLTRVARIGTHLFHFCQYRQAFGGWGNRMRRAVSNWYNEKEPWKLAYQLIKYRQRDGWTHTDVLRKAHPTPVDNDHDALFKWVIHGGTDVQVPLIQAYIEAQLADVPKLVQLITDHNLPREAIPTDKLNELDVWAALLESMPIGAMVRNLGKMSSIGLLKPLSTQLSLVTDKLADAGAISGSRIHPIQVLAALNTYSQGHGFRGNLEWPVANAIVDVLDTAFYMSFGNVVPSGKRTLLGLDVSGSMGFSEIMGVGGLTPRAAAAAMAMVTVRSEPQTHAIAFSHRPGEFPLSANERLDDVQERMDVYDFGRTDCALPMLYAQDHDLEVDTFIIYTDNETWFGNIHPSQALVQYRQATGIPAKLIVVGMTATECSIADQNDAGMLDVVGFDTATPNVVSQFSGQ